MPGISLWHENPSFLDFDGVLHPLWPPAPFNDWQLEATFGPTPYAGPFFVHAAAALVEILSPYLEELEVLAPCEILADAPLDFSMLSRVWKGRDRDPPSAPYVATLAREGQLMPRLERYFERNPDQLARRHHALVDARALRAAWLEEHGLAPNSPNS